MDDRHSDLVGWKRVLKELHFVSRFERIVPTDTHQSIYTKRSQRTVNAMKWCGFFWVDEVSWARYRFAWISGPAVAEEITACLTAK
jgi:hypothetical protein